MARKRAISRRKGSKYFHPCFTRLGTQYFTYKDFKPLLGVNAQKARKKEKKSTLFAQESRKKDHCPSSSVHQILDLLNALSSKLGGGSLSSQNRWVVLRQLGLVVLRQSPHRLHTSNCQPPRPILSIHTSTYN